VLSRQEMRLAREVARFVTGGTGLLTFGAALVGAFARTRPGSDTADTQYVIAPASFKGGRLGELDDFPGMTIGSWQMRPHSRGSVQARSPDPTTPPLQPLERYGVAVDAGSPDPTTPPLQPRYLSDPTDRQAVVEGLRFGRRLAEAAALDPYRGDEAVPGASVASDEAVLDYARRCLDTDDPVAHRPAHE
jgi:choline dehydrogenase